MIEDSPLYAAVFRDHPLGPGRYTRSFRHDLTGWTNKWWELADDAGRQKHFDWALNHPLYHYSTDDLNQAEFWDCNERDEADRAILAKYAPVDFVEVHITLTPLQGTENVNCFQSSHEIKESE